MNVFELRERLISDYSSCIRSFIRIRDVRVDALVTSCLDQGRLWPDPLIQLNPSQYAGTVDELVAEGVLHSECTRIFRAGKDKGEGKPLRLYQHQADAIRRARAGRNYVLTTGTGSGKSMAYIVPIVDHVLRHGSGRGIQPIVVYGEYRTKRVILEIYDAMTEAERTGVPYQTRLDPPPADPRVAHPAESLREA